MYSKQQKGKNLKEKGGGKNLKNKKGFTLIEIMLAVAIIGLLASVAIPRFVQTTKDAKIQACKANVANVNAQLETYNVKNGDYPSDFAGFLGSPEYFPGNEPECPFGTDYALDGNDRVPFHDHSAD